MNQSLQHVQFSPQTYARIQEILNLTPLRDINLFLAEILSLLEWFIKTSADNWEVIAIKKEEKNKLAEIDLGAQKLEDFNNYNIDTSHEVWARIDSMQWYFKNCSLDVLIQKACCLFEWYWKKKSNGYKFGIKKSWQKLTQDVDVALVFSSPHLRSK